MTRRDLALAALVFLLGGALRVYAVTYPAFHVMDEYAHVPAAAHYWNDGQFEPDFWEHPPLRHVLLYGFVEALGDNPWGWRARNVLFGALACVLTYLFARQIGGGWKPALLAGLLLATDPLHVVTSRYTFEEVYGGAFFLASIVLYLNHRERPARLALSAALMGCALATKWYYVPCWLVLGALALRRSDGVRGPGGRAFVASTWLLVPLTVYLLSFYPWFRRGYDVGELVEHNVNAYRSLQAVTARTFRPGLPFLAHASPRAWFTAPIVVGQGTYLDAGRGEFVLFVNSLPIWLLVLPATIGTAALAVRRRDLQLGVPALAFFSTYALFLGVDRPVFVYSAVPLLPLAFTAIACAVVLIADRLGAKVYWAVLAAALGWNLYLYPVVTAKQVPVALYRHVLEREGVELH